MKGPFVCNFEREQVVGRRSELIELSQCSLAIALVEKCGDLSHVKSGGLRVLG